MTETEAIEHFTETFVDKLHLQKMSELDESIEDSFSSIEQGILEAFSKLFVELVKTEKETAYITVSLLRSSIKNEGVRCLLSAYGYKWYVDKEPVEAYYEAAWLLQPLHEFDKALDIERKKYFGKITSEDTKNIKWGKLEDYKAILVLMFRRVIGCVIQLEEYQNIKKHSQFEIRVGEYYDVTESIWLENNKEFPADEIRAILERQYFIHTVYQHYKSLDLSNAKYNRANFMYTRFECVNFRCSTMVGCVLLGTKFVDCDLEGADLRGCYIWFGDFTGCMLKQANLSFVNCGVEIEAGQLEKKIFIRTCFAGADLSGANLSNGVFSGFDFRGAKLENCDMTNAVLAKTLIDKHYKDAEALLLTDEQRSEVIWV